MTSTRENDTVYQALKAARPAIERICTEVWELAEISLHEVESAKVHQRELEAAGFSMVSEGTAGVPTAFIAEWSADEQAFAQVCQRAMGVPEHGLMTTVMPLQPEPTMGGSSDVADVSWLAPTMGIVMATSPLSISMHTWPITACGGMSIGVKGALARGESAGRAGLCAARGRAGPPAGAAVQVIASVPAPAR